MVKKETSIIILTNNYPFGMGEEFIHDEIPYLTKAFKKVYIIPLLETGKLRTLSEGVELFPSQKVSKYKVLDFLKGILAYPKLMIKECFLNSDFPGDLKSVYYAGRTLELANRIKKSIIQLVQDKNLKDVIIYSYWLNQACIGGILASKKLNIPIISRAHCYDLYKETNPKNYIPYYKYKLEHLLSIAVISKNGIDYINEIDDKYSKKLHLGRLGVTDKGVIHHKIMGENMIHIASCSSLIVLKRVDLIAKSLIELANRLKSRKIKWTHLGSGPEELAIRTIIENTKPENLDVYFAGYIESEKIRSYYIKEKVDLLINYSIYEGVPVTIMEALSCGIPVIAPEDVGGISELVDNTVGLSLPSNLNEISIAETIDKFIQDADFEQLSKNARMKWDEFANAPKNYQEFSKYLNTFSNSEIDKL